MTIGQQAKENFTNLLKNGVEDDLLENLQLADFSKENFGVNFPVLHKGTEGLNKSRYYSKPILEDYYLTNDWYEKNADKLKEAFEIFGSISGVSENNVIGANEELKNYLDSITDKIEQRGLLTQFIEDGSLSYVQLDIRQHDTWWEMLITVGVDDREDENISDDEEENISDFVSEFCEENDFISELERLGNIDFNKGFDGWITELGE